MIDYINIELIGYSPETLSRHQYLDFGTFTFDRSKKQGKSKRAKYGNLWFKITNSGRIFIQGSLHKFSQHGFNFNDFALYDILKAIFILYEDFGINPNQAIIKSLEFGVNIRLPYSPKLFLDSLVNYKGDQFTVEKYGNKGHLARAEKSNYYLKIYDKGRESNQNANILRFEVKIKKMAQVNSRNNPLTIFQLMKISKLRELMLDLSSKYYDGLLFNNQSIELAKLTRKDAEFFQGCSNPIFWEKNKELTTNKKYEFKRLYKNLVDKYGSNQFEERVRKLIKEKADEQLKLDKKTVLLYSKFLSQFKYNISHSDIREKLVPKIKEYIIRNKYKAMSKEDWLKQIIVEDIELGESDSADKYYIELKRIIHRRTTQIV
jgi:hypothetical protein